MNFLETDLVSVNPESYFTDNDFEESQVISLVYSPGVKRAFFVAGFARTEEFVKWLKGGKKPDSPITDFRLLIFEGVENFKIESSLKTNQIRNSPDGINYNSRNLGAFVVEYIDLENRDILIALISSTKLRFRFNNLLVRQRFARGIKRHNKNGWVYVDIKTGEIFDFYDPFNLITV